jgi:hypothetical protein
VTVGFGPSNLARVSFHFEVFETFRPTELKNFAVVTGEHHSMAWINIAGTEVTLLNAHIYCKY